MEKESRAEARKWGSSSCETGRSIFPSLSQSSVQVHADISRKLEFTPMSWTWSANLFMQLELKRLLIRRFLAEQQPLHAKRDARLIRATRYLYLL